MSLMQNSIPGGKMTMIAKKEEICRKQRIKYFKLSGI